MKWLDKLNIIPEENKMKTHIPKKKLIDNIKQRYIQLAMQEEIDYIEDIVYHAIFRENKNSETTKEIHIIEVKLQEPRNILIIAEVFQKVIPYSQLIIFSSGEKYLLFESKNQEEGIYQNQFSKWVYEEELMMDFCLGSIRVAENNNILRCCVSWEEITEQLKELFYEASCSEYLCLRKLIDDLRIREIKGNKELVYPFLYKIVNENHIELFDGIPFILKTKVDVIYSEMCLGMYSGHLKDRRMSIDRWFEPLTKDDFCTTTEIMDLLDEMNSISWYLNDDQTDSYDDCYTKNYGI